MDIWGDYTSKRKAEEVFCVSGKEFEMGIYRSDWIIVLAKGKYKELDRCGCA
jgi:hypothetical protein